VRLALAFALTLTLTLALNLSVRSRSKYLAREGSGRAEACSVRAVPPSAWRDTQPSIHRSIGSSSY